MHAWVTKYVGLPYTQCDCAQLAALVQQEEFGRAIALPSERGAGLRALSAQIDDLQEDYADQVDIPREGDAVLMRCRGRFSHIGVYVEISGEPFVLHAVKNAGQACLHRLRDLPRHGFDEWSFWQWK